MLGLRSFKDRVERRLSASSKETEAFGRPLLVSAELRSSCAFYIHPHCTSDPKDGTFSMARSDAASIS